MKNKPQSGDIPDSPWSDRPAIVEKILGHFKGRKVLVAGIGGGGDIISTLPTCFDLERIGATAIPAGLTWKRAAHDPEARPRRISEYANIKVINDVVGMASPDTVLPGGIQHIESWLSGKMGGCDIGLIDISRGSNAVMKGLMHLMEQHDIAGIIGIDAGGDVLCHGTEKSIRSPICDQTMLAALSEIKGALLGVHSFGTDGELSFSDFLLRLPVLSGSGAFLGGLDINPDDHARMKEIVLSAPTESSRYSLGESNKLTEQQRHKLRLHLNSHPPTFADELFSFSNLPLRGGKRMGELGPLSACTMFFKADVVHATSAFASLWNHHATTEGLSEILVRFGMITEYIDR